MRRWAKAAAGARPGLPRWPPSVRPGNGPSGRLARQAPTSSPAARRRSARRAPEVKPAKRRQSPPGGGSQGLGVLTAAVACPHGVDGGHRGAAGASWPPGRCRCPRCPPPRWWPPGASPVKTPPGTRVLPGWAVEGVAAGTRPARPSLRACWPGRRARLRPRSPAGVGGGEQSMGVIALGRTPSGPRSPGPGPGCRPRKMAAARWPTGAGVVERKVHGRSPGAGQAHAPHHPAAGGS